MSRAATLAVAIDYPNGTLRRFARLELGRTQPDSAASLCSHLRRSALATRTKWARSGSSDDFRELQLPGRNGGQGGD